jgi:hypothetical protein
MLKVDKMALIKHSCCAHVYFLTGLDHSAEQGRWRVRDAVVPTALVAGLGPELERWTDCSTLSSTGRQQ